MRQVIIIGGGIGGLSAAIALRRVGIEATVFERASELKEIGASVALAANATKALRGLGLADAIKDIGVPVRNAEIRSWRGEVLSRLPVLEVSQRMGAESVAVHRADLQAVLLKELGQETVRLGAECVGFEQDGGRRGTLRRRKRGVRRPAHRGRRASLAGPGPTPRRRTATVFRLRRLAGGGKAEGGPRAGRGRWGLLVGARPALRPRETWAGVLLLVRHQERRREGMEYGEEV
jgi:hypothetical protein